MDGAGVRRLMDRLEHHVAIGCILYLAMPRDYRKLLLTATVDMPTQPLVVFGVLLFFGGVLPVRWLKQLVDHCFILTGIELSPEFLDAMVQNVSVVRPSSGMAWMRDAYKGGTFWDRLNGLAGVEFNPPILPEDY